MGTMKMLKIMAMSKRCVTLRQWYYGLSSRVKYCKRFQKKTMTWKTLLLRWKYLANSNSFDIKTLAAFTHHYLFSNEPLNTKKFEREVSLLWNVGPQFQTKKNAPKMAMKWLSRCEASTRSWKMWTYGKIPALHYIQNPLITQSSPSQTPKNPAWEDHPRLVSG